MIYQIYHQVVLKQSFTNTDTPSGIPTDTDIDTCLMFLTNTDIDTGLWVNFYQYYQHQYLLLRYQFWYRYDTNINTDSPDTDPIQIHVWWYLLIPIPIMMQGWWLYQYLYGLQTMIPTLHWYRYSIMVFSTAIGKSICISSTLSGSIEIYQIYHQVLRYIRYIIKYWDIADTSSSIDIYLIHHQGLIYMSIEI